MIYTVLNRPVGETAPTGNGITPTFSYIYKKGGRTLAATGEFENTYEKIQSQLAETKIENIIARYRSGDTSMMNTSKVYVMDKLLPKDFQDMQNKVIAIKQQFESLPATMKQKFNNNVAQFAEEYGSNEFNEKIGLKQEVITYRGQEVEAARPKNEERRDE